MENLKWSIDPTHSEIGFKVKHMMFSNVSGKFEKFEASATSEGENFENASFQFTAEASSISTGNTDRDNHLRSADFFDAEKYPEVKFTSSAMKKVADDHFELTGDLTIKGITKTVNLSVEFGGIAQDPWGNTKAGFTLTGKINRKDWGLNWNAALEAGGVLVSEEIRLTIDVQLVKS
jgi:polyisoprenoid-binding protein YceI